MNIPHELLKSLPEDQQTCQLVGEGIIRCPLPTYAVQVDTMVDQEATERYNAGRDKGKQWVQWKAKGEVYARCVVHTVPPRKFQADGKTRVPVSQAVLDDLEECRQIELKKLTPDQIEFAKRLGTEAP